MKAINSRRSETGFSMIEIMVSLAFFAILTAIAIPATIQWRINYKASAASAMISSDLAEARLLAVSKNKTAYVIFDNNNSSYRVYVDQSNNGPDPADQRKFVGLAFIAPEVEFGINDIEGIDGQSVTSSIELGSGNAVAFYPNGSVVGYGSVYLLPKQDVGVRNDRTRAVEITPNGNVARYRYKGSEGWRKLI